MNNKVLMQNKREKLTAGVISMAVAFLFLLFSMVSVYADASKVTISSHSITKGETTTVKVTYSGSNIGRVKANLTYDSSVISYKGGGSSKGDNGLVALNRAGTGKSIVFKLKFKGVGEGQSKLNLDTIEVYDLDEQPMGFVSPSGTLTVKAKGENSKKETKQNVKKDEKADKKTEKQSGTTADKKDNSNIQKSADDHGDKKAKTSFTILLGLIIVIILVLFILIVRRRRR